MFTFFQNQFTSFTSKKNGPAFAGDEPDFLQQAEQKRSELTAQIEKAQINPKAKEKFRREAELILEKENPINRLRELEESLRKYEEFVLGMRTNFLQKRDGFLNYKFEQIPLWGGPPTSFENESFPREVVEERIFWLHEFVEPLYDEQIDPTKIGVSELSATMVRMTARMTKVEAEAGRRKKQIADFLAARAEHPALASRFKKLFSRDVFARANFDERRNILLRIGDQIRVAEGKSEFLENEQGDFATELGSRLESVRSLPPTDAWAELFDEEKKLKNPPRQIKKLEIFKNWAEKFRAARVEIENKIAAQLAEISQHLAKKKGAKILRADREFLAGLNPRFKLEAKISPDPVQLELEVISQRQLKVAGESPEEETSDLRKNLFLAQKKSDFIRRILTHTVALAMAFGKTSTASETQKQLVHDDALERKSLEEVASEKLRKTAVEQTARKVDEAEASTRIDTIGAAQNSESIQVLGGRAGISEEAQSDFQTDKWELTRLVGISVWPPHELQNYLEAVRRSGHRLEVTNNYMPISSEYAANLLRQRVAANLDELPGETAKQKNNYRHELMGMIDGAQKSDDGFVERVFSYTTND